MSKFDTRLASGNLCRLHRLLGVILVKGVLGKGAYSKVKLSPGATVETRLDITVDMDDDQVHSMLQSFERWPIEQCAVGRNVWHRMFDRLLSANLSSMAEWVDKEEVNLFEWQELVGKVEAQTEWKHSMKKYTVAPGYTNGADRNILLEYDSGVCRIARARLMNDSSYAEELFPLKKDDAASQKQNVLVSGLYRSLRQTDRGYWKLLSAEICSAIGATNDRVCCAIMSHYALYVHGFVFPFYRYWAYLSNRSLVKAVSDLTKMCGIANSPWLTLFTEADCLEGRGSLKADSASTFNEITNKPPAGKGVVFDDGVIYDKAMQVYRESMPVLAGMSIGSRWQNAMEPESAYWARRHERCVNGAHHLPSGVADFEYQGTKTRMAFLEKKKYSTLFRTKPKIEATMSLKLENPKVRDILAGDTLSYLNEDYVMKGVERHWHSDSILLDPGESSRMEEVERVRDMPGNTYLMLDYAAMDRQASLKSQVEVVTALCDFLGAPKHVKNWLITSNTEQFVRLGGKKARVKFGLLTGRRMTTFMNTVLNVCYFREAVPSNLICASKHAGDDIVATCQSKENARAALRAALSSKSTYNPRKQSLGPAAEFLRVAIRGNLGLCYLNRTIASCVCGNWVNKMRLAETDMVSQFALFSWTLDNRGFMRNYAHNLLMHSCHQRCKISKRLAGEICSNQVSVNGSPVRTGKDVIKTIRTTTGIIIDDRALKREPAHASSANVEELLRIQPRAVVTVREKRMIKAALKRASYSKSLHVGNEPRKFDHSIVQRRVAQREMTSSMMRNRSYGVASKHPLVTVIRSIFNRHMSEILGVILTGQRPPRGVDLDTWIYGRPSVIVNGNVGMDYSDLSIMGNVLSGVSDEVVDVRTRVACYT